MHSELVAVIFKHNSNVYLYASFDYSNSYDICSHEIKTSFANYKSRRGNTFKVYHHETIDPERFHAALDHVTNTQDTL